PHHLLQRPVPVIARVVAQGGTVLCYALLELAEATTGAGIQPLRVHLPGAQLVDVLEPLVAASMELLQNGLVSEALVVPNELRPHRGVLALFLIVVTEVTGHMLPDWLEGLGQALLHELVDALE